MITQTIYDNQPSLLPTSNVIQFNGSRIPTIMHKEKPYVAIKPICEALGLDWEGQRQRIRRDSVLKEGTFITKVPTESGEQEMLLLLLEMFNGWLFGISDKRVRPDLKEKIIYYKRECYHALHQHFFSAPTKTDFSLTKDQIGQLYHAVMLRAGEDGKKCQYFWSRFKNHFKTASYKDLPNYRFDEALEYIKEMPDKEVKALPAPIINLDKNEIRLITSGICNLLDADLLSVSGHTKDLLKKAFGKIEGCVS